MRVEFSIKDGAGRHHDVVVEGSSVAPVGDVLADYRSDGSALYCGSIRVDPAAPLGAGQVVNGARLTVGTPTVAKGWPVSGPTLAVVGGAASATFQVIPMGTTTVGRTATVTVADPTVSARHASLTLKDDGSLLVTDLGSTNGTYVDGVRLAKDQSVTVHPGQRFLLGKAVVSYFTALSPNGSVDRSDDGRWLFNRVTRFHAPPVEAQIVIPTPPIRSGGSVLIQLITSGAMLVAGVGSAVLLGNLLYAVLGVLAPAAIIGATVATQRGVRRQDASRRKDYEQTRTRAETELQATILAEAEEQWSATVDPASCALAALGPTSALWSVDGRDAAAMAIRVGTVDRPAKVVVKSADGTVLPSPTLVATPVTLDLRQHSVVGVAGNMIEARAVARAMVHQLAVTRSPDELLIFHLSAEENTGEWSWLRWLPHVRGVDDSVHTVSPSADALTARLLELDLLMDQRRSVVESGWNAGQLILPEVLVVMDGAGVLRSRSSVVRVLKEGPALGLRVLAIDRLTARLPVEASARLIIDSQHTGEPVAQLETSTALTVEAITVDLVSTAIAERAARALGPMCPLGRGDDTGLPDSLRFADLAGLTGAGPADICRRWSAGKECQVALGVDVHGTRAVIDLVEDGPHVLIAGTSGSGKSEFLRTLIAGLALSASPADLAFLLIDYKGGGAFGKLESLPHVVGYADDLSIGGVLANRLLQSLLAELDWRKARFKEAGNVEGLDRYREARSRNSALPAVARLVIVVDEFAELKQAQPDFVDGLVNVARTGRSLGVHLVLATQQPAGVVTPQIRDNANLRVCLRVLDAGTSRDIVGSAGAAAFPAIRKGRAIVSTGNRQILLQTAYISAPVRQTHEDTPPPTIHELPWLSCGEPVKRPQRAEESTDSRTDLSEFVTQIRAAATASRTAEARTPWHPPLPISILLSDLVPEDRQLPFGMAPFAIEDVPNEQRQSSVSLLLGFGNIGIVGGGSSGRTTALRTIAASLTARHSAEDVHIHVIDQTSASLLRPLIHLQHCGTVATRNERYKTDSLARRLVMMLSERGQLLSDHSASSLRELRESGHHGPPPFVVVFIDDWDYLSQTAGEQTIDNLLRVAVEGPSLGIQLVVAGGKAVMAAKLIGSLPTLLVLPFEQRDDLAFFGVPIRQIPEGIPAGRAHRPRSGQAVQIALLDRNPAADAQARVIGEIAERSAVAHPLRAPLALDELPGKFALDDALRLSGAKSATGDHAFIAAVAGDELNCRTVDLDRLNGPFVVAGPPGSGRTASLVSIATQLTAKGTRVVVVLADEGDAARFTGAELLGIDPTGAVPSGCVLLVDDAGRFPDTEPFLARALDDPTVRMVLAGDPDTLSGFIGWKARVKSGMAGLLFSAQPGQGDLIGCPITYRNSFTGNPGRAYLGLRRKLELAQVPWAG